MALSFGSVIFYFYLCHVIIKKLKVMSKKVAKLVRVSLVTRVIVDVDATEQEIMELAVPKLSENLMDAPFENLEEIVDDTECPYEENGID